ncbi:MAG: LysM peptidoglycan-binding domain-containing protein [Planctomycetaceae bacterium]|nr:LysM peptidoglycan-binding domain-containing protein [Planctomycetaceae bacterium]
MASSDKNSAGTNPGRSTTESTQSLNKTSSSPEAVEHTDEETSGGLSLETKLGMITIVILVLTFGFLVYRKVDMHQQRLMQASISPQKASASDAPLNPSDQISSFIDASQSSIASATHPGETLEIHSATELEEPHSPGHERMLNDNPFSDGELFAQEPTASTSEPATAVNGSSRNLNLVVPDREELSDPFRMETAPTANTPPTEESTIALANTAPQATEPRLSFDSLNEPAIAEAKPLNSEAEQPTPLQTTPEVDFDFGDSNVVEPPALAMQPEHNATPDLAAGDLGFDAGRPAFPATESQPAPEFVFGELSEETTLASNHARPSSVPEVEGLDLNGAGANDEPGVGGEIAPSLQPQETSFSGNDPAPMLSFDPPQREAGLQPETAELEVQLPDFGSLSQPEQPVEVAMLDPQQVPADPFSTEPSRKETADPFSSAAPTLPQANPPTLSFDDEPAFNLHSNGTKNSAQSDSSTDASNAGVEFFGEQPRTRANPSSIMFPRADGSSPQQPGNQRRNNSGIRDGKFSLAAFNNVTAVEPPVDDGGNYEVITVQNGDNYTKISKRVYGTIRYFSALAVFNQHRIPDPSRMRPGMKVLTPPADLLEQRYPELFVDSKPRTALPARFIVREDGSAWYRVGENETLSEIAERYLGRSSRWIEIYRLNQSILRDPNRLKTGLVLALPDDAVEVSISPN